LFKRPFVPHHPLIAGLTDRLAARLVDPGDYFVDGGVLSSGRGRT
jgi:hypothetical protein